MPRFNVFWMLAIVSGSFLCELSLVAIGLGGEKNREKLQPFTVLPPDHQAYLDQVLEYWERSSAQIHRYRCEFTRWEYDPVFGPRDVAKNIARGFVQYESPDKGMFEVHEIYDYKARREDGTLDYEKRATDAHEKWVCSGQSVFEFDAARKVLVERQLPPNMRGNAMVDGPLPFLFGAQAEKIKRRYWVQVITPPGTNGEYWLEAWPKRREDAGNFKFVEIIIDAEDFLPKAIQIFGPGFAQNNNQSRTAFEFTSREINPFDLKDLDKLHVFHRAFHQPKVPKGWTKETHRFQ